MDVGLMLYERWILIGLMLDFGCVNVWELILVGLRWNLVVWTLDFGCLDVEFW